MPHCIYFFIIAYILIEDIEYIKLVGYLVKFVRLVILVVIIVLPNILHGIIWILIIILFYP